jgi:ribosomal protein L37AE/L43A
MATEMTCEKCNGKAELETISGGCEIFVCKKCGTTFWIPFF